MNREELEELYNEFVIRNGNDYWKCVIIERLLMKEEEEIGITEEQINEMVDSIMFNDNLWQEIDEEIGNIITEMQEE
jgi:hypothetical protein